MKQASITDLPGTSIEPRYPDSDGRLMGDTDFHNTAMSEIKERLQDYYAPQEDVYVASNLILYRKEGDPKSRKDPDILVAKGVQGKHPRRSFRVWQEKVLPRVLFEIASKKTWRNDVGLKRKLYAKIGISEYFIFDPEGLYIDPPLQGFRTVKGKSVPIEYEHGVLHSKELGLYFSVEGSFLHIVETATNQPLLTRVERSERDRQQAEHEKARADLAEELAKRTQELAEREKQRADLLERLVKVVEGKLDEHTKEITELKQRLNQLDKK